MILIYELCIIRFSREMVTYLDVIGPVDASLRAIIHHRRQGLPFVRRFVRERN